jgi:two-component system response regulator AtoC
MNVSILAVDDERDFLESLARALRVAGYADVTTRESPAEALALFERESFDVALLDITMPGMDGLELLTCIKERSPQTECIMVTANESVPLVVRAVRLGAYDYLVKPLTPEQVSRALERALERKWLLESLRIRSGEALAAALRNPEAFSRIVTGSDRMLRLMHEAELHAASQIPVLITGETGVGKELLAHALHDASDRASRPFVAVNMLALSPALFESEFFGHVKGAFTGADRDRAGHLAQAEGGTLFLDEIGDMSADVQGKLLRVLQEGEYVPVGKTSPERADVRFIAATNRDLARSVRQGKFRKDLFYRLQFAHLHVPPLRDRKEDIPLLAAAFLQGARRPGVTLSDEAADLLSLHDWPGNVRELKGALEAAVNLAEEGVVRAAHLRLPVTARARGGKQSDASRAGLEPLADVERRHIIAVYEAVGRNKTRAAEVLGIGLQTLRRRLQGFGVS